jgi:CTP synthase (UTP-ammonia lyase)
VSDAATDIGWIAVIGDRVPGFDPQDAIEASLAHSAAAIGEAPVELRWLETDALADAGERLLDGAAAVWCAPGSPYRSLDGAVAGIRWAREGGVPFLGACAGFQHGVIEFARNVLARGDAAHAEYGSEGELLIDELLCSLVGQVMAVELVDNELVSIYGDRHATERYYCRFGLDPEWRAPLDAAGPRVAGVDGVDGDVRLLRLTEHPFFVLTLFAPQTSSAPRIWTSARSHP